MYSLFALKDGPEKNVKLLLDVCETLLKMEEEAEAAGNKRDLQTITESMRLVCDMAFDEAEADAAE